MSSFVENNLNRFNRIQDQYKTLSQGVGAMFNPSMEGRENDLKSKLEYAGNTVESGANLYLEGRKIIHDLKSAKTSRGLLNELKSQGIKNIQHLTKQNKTLQNICKDVCRYYSNSTI